MGCGDDIDRGEPELEALLKDCKLRHPQDPRKEMMR